MAVLSWVLHKGRIPNDMFQDFRYTDAGAGHNHIEVSPLLKLPYPRLNILISLLVASSIAVTLAIALWLFDATLRHVQAEAQSARVINIAQTVAAYGNVVQALQQANQPGTDISSDSALERDINRLRQRLGIDFISIFNRQSLRLTHPDPELVGLPFQGGDEGPSLQGRTYSSRAQGTLGTSIRGFSPVMDGNGQVIGAVAVGVTLATLGDRLAENRLSVLLGVALLMLFGVLGAGWLARYLKHVLMGLEPHQIARLVEERQAILGSVHEGILAIDSEGRISLTNAAAHQLLHRAGLDVPVYGTRIDTWLPQAGLMEVLREGKASLDREVLINGLSLLTNRMPIRHQGQIIGAVATFRDTSEVHMLAEELTGVRRYAEALRAATHEFKNKLHAMLGLVQMKEYTALHDYMLELADHHVAPGAALVREVEEPVLAGFLLGKQSEARERGIVLSIEVEEPIPAPESSTLIHTLVIIIGNLLENAFDAVSEQDERHVTLTLGHDESLLSLHVQDTGTGISDALKQRIFQRGISTKGAHRGLGLAMVREQIEAHDGDLALYSEPPHGTLIEVTLPYRAGSGARD